ncbi:hypothetical protein GOODEAATRI_019953 [Goodea atripinnis]|uniref:Uncharacterized protein n=1 Tax=Goodea atripinnis TaxID=208336 RepID=A0ABV0PZH4_9TELE
MEVWEQLMVLKHNIQPGPAAYVSDVLACSFDVGDSDYMMMIFWIPAQRLPGESFFPPPLHSVIAADPALRNINCFRISLDVNFLYLKAYCCHQTLASLAV